MTERAGARPFFFYGSLQIDAVLEAVTGRRYVAKPARLPGFRRRRLVGRTYPGVVPDAEATTPGVLVAGIPEADWAVLDRFEGEPYERCTAAVALDDGSKTEAFVYQLRAEWHSLMGPEHFDLEAFRERDLDGFLAECRRWRAGLRAGGIGEA